MGWADLKGMPIDLMQAVQLTACNVVLHACSRLHAFGESNWLCCTFKYLNAEWENASSHADVHLQVGFGENGVENYSRCSAIWRSATLYKAWWSTAQYAHRRTQDARESCLSE